MESQLLFNINQKIELFLMRSIIPLGLRLLGASGSKRTRTAEKWLVENGDSKESLAILFSHIKKPEKKSTITQHWIKRGKRDLNDLLFALPFLANSSDKGLEIEHWIIKNKSSQQDLARILATIKDDIDKAPIVKLWVGNKADFDLEDALFALPILSNNSDKLSIAQIVIRRNQFTQPELERILATIENDADLHKSKIVETWISKKGSDLGVENLRFVSGFLGKSELVTNSIKSLSEKNALQDLSSEDLVFILPHFVYDHEKLQISESSIKKNRPTQKDLEKILASFEDEYNKSQIVRLWTSKEALSTDDLAFILPRFTNDREKSKIIKASIEKNRPTLEELRKILAAFDDESYKSKIVKLWFDNGDSSLEDLLFVLPFFAFDYEKSEIIKASIEKNRPPQKDLEKILTSFKEEYYKSEIVRLWIGKEALSTDNLVFVLALPFLSDWERMAIAESSTQKNLFTGGDLEKITKAAIDESYKSKIVKFYTYKKWDEKKDFSLEDFSLAAPFFTMSNKDLEIVKSFIEKNKPERKYLEKTLASVGNKFYKSKIVGFWVDKELAEKEILDSEDLSFALPFFIDVDNKEGLEVAQSLIKKFILTQQDLEQVLANVADKSGKSKIIEIWIADKENFSSDGLKVFLPLIENAKNFFGILDKWLNEEERNLEELKSILPLFSDVQQFDIARLWLKKITEGSLRNDGFFNLLTSGILGTAQLVGLYKSAKISIDEFTELGTELHPNLQSLQDELSRKFINKSDPQYWLNSQEISAPILHKIWFGSSFLSREGIKQNLIEAARELPKYPEFTKIIWTDRDLIDEENHFAEQYEYNVVNIKKLFEFDRDFFKHKTTKKDWSFLLDSQPYTIFVDLKEYVLPQPEELFPDYGRRSDVARAFLLRKFAGLYMDTDELLSESKLYSELELEFDERCLRLYRKLSESDFIVNHLCNSIILAQQNNSKEINQVLDKICSKIEAGYPGVVRNIHYTDLIENIKRHNEFTVFSTGPVAYSPLNQEQNFLPRNATNSWIIGKHVFDKVELLKKEKPNNEEFKLRLIGQLRRDARDKLDILNVAKYRYIVSEVMNLSDDETAQMVDESILEVKKDFTEWQPRELRSLDEVSSIYAARKIYKYCKEELSPEQKEKISGLYKGGKSSDKVSFNFFKKDKEGENGFYNLYRLFMAAYKKQDQNFLKLLYENAEKFSKPERNSLLSEKNYLFYLAVQSNEGIFQDFIQILDREGISLPIGAKLNNKKYEFYHTQNISEAESEFLTFAQVRETLKASKPDLWPTTINQNSLRLKSDPGEKITKASASSVVHDNSHNL